MRAIERRILKLEALHLASIPPKPWAVFIPGGAGTEEAFRAQHQGQDLIIVKVFNGRRPSHEGA